MVTGDSQEEVLIFRDKQTLIIIYIYHHHHHYHHHYPNSQHHHQALSRVVAVSGDITEDRLGLCPEEENLLAQTVTAILRTIMRMIVGMVMTVILLSP